MSRSMTNRVMPSMSVGWSPVLTASDAVAALPDQLRTAVKLVYFRGLKYREAADELSVPVGTVKSRIHSAVKRLSEAWDDSQAAPPA